MILYKEHISQVWIYIYTIYIYIFYIYIYFPQGYPLLKMHSEVSVLLQGHSQALWLARNLLSFELQQYSGQMLAFNHTSQQCDCNCFTDCLPQFTDSGDKVLDSRKDVFRSCLHSPQHNVMY